MILIGALYDPPRKNSRYWATFPYGPVPSLMNSEISIKSQAALFCMRNSRNPCGAVMDQWLIV